MGLSTIDKPYNREVCGKQTQTDPEVGQRAATVTHGEKVLEEGQSAAAEP